jgi:hypothetical protein
MPGARQSYTVPPVGACQTIYQIRQVSGRFIYLTKTGYQHGGQHGAEYRPAWQAIQTTYFMPDQETNDFSPGGAE